MRVEILGPVVVTDGGRPVVLASKERAVLTALSLAVGTPVAPAALFNAVWGEEPPPTAAKTLQSHVSRLRHALGEGAITTDHAGYRLAIPPDAVDAVQLESLVESGAQAFAAADPSVATARFTDAEALWRGEPLTDLADTPERAGLVASLQELVLRARLGRIDAELALGHHESVVAELEHLVADAPLSEPQWAQLILALYRSGRQTEALQAHRRMRTILADEAGVDPSPKLERLEWQILTHDPQLDLEARPRQGSLPEPISSFVGRAAELRDASAAVEGHRLVTLHGPGGVGKSRLALETARSLSRRFADGAWWIDVTVANDVDDVVSRVADVVGMDVASERVTLDTVSEYVRHRKLLIVFDNCEHVVDAVRAVAGRLLRSASGLRVLATSRVVLDLEGEMRQAVSPLAVPDADAGPAEAAAAEAVELFQQRRATQATQSVEGDDMAAVAELTRRLGGLPLAIELAAARTRHLTPAEISELVAVRLGALGRGPGHAEPAHHRTVRAAIDWSYDSLEAPTQHVFDRVSVFPDDFDLAAAEVVGAASDASSAEVLDHLSRLVDASMLGSHAVGGSQRFRNLAILREYGVARLVERGEVQSARRAHADYFRSIAREAGPQIDGSEGALWWHRLFGERHNIRAAVRWSLDHDERRTTTEFARSLARTSEIFGGFGEIIALLQAMLDGADETPSDRRGWCWVGMMTPAFLTGDVDLALRSATEATGHFEAADSDAGLATVKWSLGSALLLGVGDVDGAANLLLEASELAAAAGLPILEAWATAQLAQCQLFGNQPLALIEPLLIRSEGLADTQLDVLQAHLAMNRCYFAYRAGDYDQSERDAGRAIELGERSRSSIYGQIGRVGLGACAFRRGRLGDARSHLLRAAQIAIDAGNTLQLGIAAQGLAAIADVNGAARSAARLWGFGTGAAPTWPFIASTWFPALARETLADRFDVEVGLGAGLTTRQVIDLAIG